ncbi:MAG: DJ-1/PfpI family protein [Candidatus Syntrophoarchaeum sp. WYZ-LMO15]|nr:MAG: DJ-1/PfpI family protein [Candidatus Syntrophoarchaeum sp. WYZ-LMO15]
MRTLGLVLLILLILSTMVGCIDQPEKEGTIDLTQNCTGGRILIIIAPEDFRDEEVLVPEEIFEEYGFTVDVASTTKKVAEGMRGTKIKPDLAFSDVNVGDYDAIVIAGGIGSREYLWGDDLLRSLVIEAYNREKIVAAICLSPVILARAGILDGKNATVFPDDEAIKELVENGAIYQDEEVVVSDRIITGRDPHAARVFALRIIERERYLGNGKNG